MNAIQACLGGKEMIYFDHAASSFPKPTEVVQAVSEALTDYSANPGRGNHALAEQAANVIREARQELADFFGLSNPNRVIFFQNATMALNQAILGFPFQRGDHVMTTTYEHNSVRRPLEACVKEKGNKVTYVSVRDGKFHEEEWSRALRDNTKLIAVTHASNVTGELIPLEAISQFAKQHHIPLLVDASQTAGVLPIDMEEMGIDLLAFPGHKSLLGPQGTGVLLIREGIELNPLVYGGTGAHSESREQPKVLPYKFESGTLNTPGIAGLLAGLRVVKARTLEAIRKHESELANDCLRQLKAIDGIDVYGNADVGVIAFSITGVDSHEIAMILDQHYQIAVRAGLHCAPLTHEQLETIDTGLIRVSFGFMNTKEEVDTFIQAMKEIKQYY